MHFVGGRYPIFPRSIKTANWTTLLPPSSSATLWWSTGLCFRCLFSQYRLSTLQQMPLFHCIRVTHWITSSTSRVFLLTLTQYSMDTHDVAGFFCKFNFMGGLFAFLMSGWHTTCMQVTVAILLNSFLGAIHSAQTEAAEAAVAGLKSKEMLRSVTHKLALIPCGIKAGILRRG